MAALHTTAFASSVLRATSSSVVGTCTCSWANQEGPFHTLDGSSILTVTVLWKHSQLDSDLLVHASMILVGSGQ